MNLLSDNPFNENLCFAYEQAQQRFIQISNMEKDEYEKFIHLKRLSRKTEDRIRHIEQSWTSNISKIYLCYCILIFFFLTLAITCILLALK
jgi:hypothetical protein